MAMFKKRGRKKVLAKGYKFLRGGRVVKAKAAKKAGRKRRRRSSFLGL